MPIPPGTLFGPYEIQAALGAGGMGDVYRATDTRLGRTVALKIIKGEFSDRFEREARAISALNHPHICVLHDIGASGEQHYLVMEYLEGKPIEGPPPIPQVLQYARQILDALDAAHQKGITHRDLKPANILVTKGGVKLLDFGLAKVQAKAAGNAEHTVTIGLTSELSIVGTPHYMAPEQIEGRDIDARTDIFSFGCVLYEMIAGKKAFDGKTSATAMAAVLATEPPAISTLQPATPPALAGVLRTCLAKDPEERWQSARDIRKALEWAAEDRPAAPAPPRHPWVWPAVAGAAVLLALGFALPTMLSPSRIDTSNLRFTPIATEAESERDPAWSPDGKGLAYVQAVAGVFQVFVRRFDSPTAEQITRMSTRCSYPFWARDGSRIYFVSGVSGFRELWSVALSGGAPELVLNTRNGNPLQDGFTISPDGKSLLVFQPELASEPGSLWVGPLSGVHLGEMHRYQPSPSQRIVSGAPRSRLRFSPDGSKLLVLGRSESRETVFWLLPWPEGRGSPRRVLQSVRSQVLGMDWLPDSRHVLFSEGLQGSQILIADVESDMVQRLTDGRFNAITPAVAPGGSRITYVEEDDIYDIVELPLDGSSVRPLIATSRIERYPVWSPVAEQFAYLTDRTGAPEVWLQSRKEGSSRPLVRLRDVASNSTVINSLAFSPDGQRILFTSGTTMWISSLAGSPPVRVTGVNETGIRGDWSPDGEWIAYLRLDGVEYHVEKTRSSGQQAPVRIARSANGCSPLWSPAGDWIAITNPALVLVSPDGQKQKKLRETFDPLTSAYGWSRDGKVLYVAYPEKLRLVLDAIQVETGVARRLADYGDVEIGAPGGHNILSMSPDGKSLATSLWRRRADIWMIEGLEMPGNWFTRLWSRGR